MNWICCGNVIKQRAACPDCGAHQVIIKCRQCGQDVADSPLVKDGVCPDCIGATMRAKVYVEKPFSLLYDNGTGYYDCAGVHETLEGAIRAARQGCQDTRQIITDDEDCQNVVWSS